LRQYRINGASDELAAAVEAFEVAAVLAVPGYPDRGLALADLGMALRDRFEAYGEQADLRRAVDVLEEAVQLTETLGKTDVPARRAALVNLGSVLLTAVAGGGPDSELRRALEVLTEADALPPGTGAEQTALLAALGDAQLQSHLRWRRPAALDTAVAAITAAVSLAGTDSARERSNLGVALSERHLMTGDIGDLQQSMELLADAVEATPEHSPDLPARQANLGTVLVERYH
jgi:tetratricopeptide (TPR) repeat protein